MRAVIRAVFLAISFSEIVHAQLPFVHVGLSVQNDVGMAGPRGAVASHFDLSPIGLMVGVGVASSAGASSSLDVAVQTAVYPLLSSVSVTPASSGQTPARRTFLVLGSINVRWTPDRTTSFPWFIEGGVVRSFQSPRNAIRNSILIGAGFTRRLSEKVSGEVGLELLAPRIGNTVVQLPVLLSMHF